MTSLLGAFKSWLRPLLCQRDWLYVWTGLIRDKSELSFARIDQRMELSMYSHEETSGRKLSFAAPELILQASSFMFMCVSLSSVTALHASHYASLALFLLIPTSSAKAKTLSP